MGYNDIFKTLREKFAKMADIPSGVASSKDLKQLKGALDETDGERKSQVLPQFASMTDQIQKILGTIGQGGGGGSGGGGGGGGSGGGGGGSGGGGQNQANNTANTPEPLTTMVIGDLSSGLCGALEIEAGKRGLQLVTSQYANLFVDVGWGSLFSDYKDIFTTAYVDFGADIAANTPMAHVIGLPNTVFEPSLLNSNPALNPPPNTLIVSTPPDLYWPQYYANTNNPYPGWIQYHSISNYDDVVYVAANSSTSFENVDAKLQYEAQQEFVTAIDAHIAGGGITLDLMVDTLKDVIDKYLEITHKELFGNNANQQNQTSQMMQGLQNMVSSAKSDHLPESFLNKEAIEKLLQEHSQDCSKAKQMVELAKKALQPGQGGQGGGGQ
jgi:hypothetical protein